LLRLYKPWWRHQVTLYMCELYNDQLLDLMDKKNTKKLEIKKDAKGGQKIKCKMQNQIVF